MPPVAAAFTSNFSYSHPPPNTPPPLSSSTSSSLSTLPSPTSSPTKRSYSTSFQSGLPPPPNQPPPAPPTSRELPTTARLSNSFVRREPPPALPPLPPLPSIGSLDMNFSNSENNNNDNRTSLQSSKSRTSSSNSNSNTLSVYYTPEPSPASPNSPPPPPPPFGFANAITTTTSAATNTNTMQNHQENSFDSISSRPRNKKKLGINTTTAQPRNSRVVQSLYYPTSPTYSPLAPTLSNQEHRGSHHSNDRGDIPPVPQIQSEYLQQSQSQTQQQSQSQSLSPTSLDSRSARIRPIQSQASSIKTTQSGFYNNKLLNSMKSAASTATTGTSSHNYNMPAATSLMQSVGGINAKYFSDEEAKTKLRLLATTDAKFDEIIEFGFPVVCDKNDYELTSNIRKQSISNTSLDSDTSEMAISPINDQWKRISMVPRDMTLKITLSPATMRADEEAIYGWQRDHIDSTGTIKSTKSLGAVDEDTEDLDPPPPLETQQQPGSPTSIDTASSGGGSGKKTIGKKMFGRFKKQPKEKTPNAAMIITSADME